MAYICEFIAGDKSMQLGYEQVIRAMPFGPNWTTIKIGVLFSIYGSGDLAGGRNLYMGVCTGAKAALDKDCIDAYYSGCFTFASTSSTTYSPSGYYTGNSGNSVGFVQQVGTSTQIGNSLVFSSQRVSALPSLYRTLNMFTITKSANGLMNFAGYYYTTLTDTTLVNYRAALENTGTPAGMTAASQAYTPTLRSDRDWNAAFLSWNTSLPTVNIYAWSIARFA